MKSTVPEVVRSPGFSRNGLADTSRTGVPPEGGTTSGSSGTRFREDTLKRGRQRWSSAFRLSAWALALFACLSACAQGPVLIGEVISREYGLFNGQGPDNQIISREVGLFVGQGPDNQTVSREYSLVLCDSNAPPALTGTDVAVTVSPRGDTVTLNWSSYNQWAVRDVSYYAVYFSATPFTSVTNMTAYRIVPGEQMSVTFTGLTEWVDHFFAVVPVDGLGNFNPNVIYSAAYVLMPQVISREVGLFVGQGPDNQVISREYSMVRCDATSPPALTDTQVAVTVSPDGSTVSLNWSSYNQWAVRDVGYCAIYWSESPFNSVTGTPYQIVPGETLSVTLTNLPAWHDHFFAVVPVDGLGNFNTNVIYSAAYVLMPQVISREFAMFVGQGPDKQVISREVTFVKGSTNVPAAVTYAGSPFAVQASVSKYGAIDLDWTAYNEWAERDIVRYRIYVSTQFFGSVSASATNYLVSANGTQRDTVVNLACEQVYFVAIVAEDVQGQFNTNVYPISSKASVCLLGDVSNLVGDAYTTNIRYTWDLGGVGTDLGNFIDHFNVYFDGASLPVAVAGTNRSWIATNLTPDVVYTVRVTTVDKLNTESAGASLGVLAGGTPLRWDVDGGTTNAQDGSGTWLAGGTAWWNGGANTNWSNTKPDRAIFGNGGTAGVVTLAGPVSVWNMTFNPVQTGIYTLVSNTLTLVASPAIILNTNATIHSALAGSGFRTSGAGELTLGGNNSFTGPVSVAGGTIKLAATNALANATAVAVASGAQLNLAGVRRPSKSYSYTISGAGPDGNGAIVSTNLALYGVDSTVKWLSLSSHATIGALGTPTNDQGRLDIGVSGGIQGNGFTLTKAGTGMVAMRGAATNLQTVVNDGLLYAEDVNSAFGTNVLVNARGKLGAYGPRTLSVPVTFNGGTLTVIGGGGTPSWNGTITLNSNVLVDTFPGYLYGTGDVVVAGLVVGAGGITKTGANALVLSADNAFSGGVTVAQGMLQLGAGGTSGAVLGTITNNGVVRWARADALTLMTDVVGSGSLDVNVASGLTVTAGARIEIGGAIQVPNSGRGAMVITSGAVVSAGSVFLGNTNGWPGMVAQHGGAVALGGTLRIGHWPSETSTYVMAGGSITISNEPIGNPFGTAESNGVLYVGIDGTGRFIMTGGVLTCAGVVLDNRSDTPGQDAFVLEGGTARIGRWGIQGNASTYVGLGGGVLSATTNWSGSRPMILTGTNGASTFDPGIFSVTVNGTISGAGGLIKAGSGSLTLSNLNTFSGGLVVVAGTLRLNAGGAPGTLAGNGPITVGGNSTLLAGITDALGYTNNNTGNSLTIQAGGTVSVVTGNRLSMDRSVFCEGGMIASQGGGDGTGASYTFRDLYGATYQFTSSTGGQSSVISATGIGLQSNTTFNVPMGGGAIDLLVSGALINNFQTGVLIKVGNGVMVLAASNTYSGPTFVSNGTLLVNGSISTGAVTISVAGTLGGTGTIRGPVTSAGTVAPGASAGTLTMVRPYVQSSGAALAIELGGTSAGSYDALVVSNTATLGGALNVSLINGFSPASSNSFTVLRASTLSGVFATTNLPPLLPGLRWVVSYPANAVVLSVTGAPLTGYAAYALQITNVALRGVLDDADSDGYANLLEYATGGDPTNLDQVARMSGVRTNGGFALRFNRNTNANDALLIVEGAFASTNGAAWNGIATNLGGSWGGATNVVEVDGTNPAPVAVHDTAAPATNRFLRLRVTRP